MKHIPALLHTPQADCCPGWGTEGTGLGNAFFNWSDEALGKEMVKLMNALFVQILAEELPHVNGGPSEVLSFDSAGICHHALGE